MAKDWNYLQIAVYDTFIQIHCVWTFQWCFFFFYKCVIWNWVHHLQLMQYAIAIDPLCYLWQNVHTTFCLMCFVNMPFTVLDIIYIVTSNLYIVHFRAYASDHWKIGVVMFEWPHFTYLDRSFKVSHNKNQKCIVVHFLPFWTVANVCSLN